MALEKPTWELYDVLEENPETNLFDNYIVEHNDIAGIKLRYFTRREDIEMDQLYGESLNTAYHAYRETKGMMEIQQGSEQTTTDIFGIVGSDVIEFLQIPKSTFSRDITASPTPKPGDVVYFPWNQRAYEVVDADEENVIFNLRKLVWGLVLKPYRFSDQSDSAKAILQSPDSTLSQPLTAYGDNAFVEEESNTIHTYPDVDTGIFGF